MKRHPLNKHIKSSDEPRLIPPDMSAPDGPDEHDLSYQDAVLDVEMRHFFGREYGDARPPEGVYSRVLHSINAGKVPVPVAARVPSLASRLSSALSRALAGPTTARLVPGAIALMLIVGLLGTNTARFLTGQSDLRAGEAFSAATENNQERSAQFYDVKSRPMEEPVTRALLDTTNEMLAYDPYELGLSRRSSVARSHDTGHEQDSSPYVTSKMGPQ